MELALVAVRPVLPWPSPHAGLRGEEWIVEFFRWQAHTCLTSPKRGLTVQCLFPLNHAGCGERKRVGAGRSTLPSPPSI
jgi:hypothetical protein